MSYDKIHHALNSATNDNVETTRRRFPRRMADICVVMIGGTTYPVHDWSQCGVLFEADGRDFKAGSDFEAVMKFKLAQDVTEIQVSAHVVRAGKTQVALEFAELPKKIQKAFTKVIEDAMAQTGSEAENQA